MKKEDHINQHIVPRSYLRRFGQKSKGRYIIGVRQKETELTPPKLFINRIENVGYLRRYYDTPNKMGAKYWEVYYADKIDPLYGKPLSSIITRITLSSAAKTPFCLSAEEKELLAKMICFQMLRVPPVIEPQLDSAPQLLSSIKHDFIRKNRDVLPKELLHKAKTVEVPRAEVKDMILQHITNIAELDVYIKALMRRIWLIYVNTTECSFMTSDCPVLQYNLNSNSSASEDVGIGRNDTALLFPLTPSLMIHLLPDYFVYSNLKHRDGKTVLLGTKDLDFVFNCNIKQMETCFHQTFMDLRTYEYIRHGEEYLSHSID